GFPASWAVPLLHTIAAPAHFHKERLWNLLLARIAVRHFILSDAQLAIAARPVEKRQIGRPVTLTRVPTAPQRPRRLRKTVRGYPLPKPKNAPTAKSTLSVTRRGFVIVPDVKWPGMYRLRCPDGTLTDLINITRARDALTELAHSFEETT